MRHIFVDRNLFRNERVENIEKFFAFVISPRISAKLADNVCRTCAFIEQRDTAASGGADNFKKNYAAYERF